MATQSEAISKLAGIISNPTLRKQFAAKPQETLKSQGVDTSKIPKGLVDTLSDLSHAELRALSRVKDSLGRSKIPTADIMKIV